MKTMFSHMFVAKYFRSSADAIMPWNAEGNEASNTPAVSSEQFATLQGDIAEKARRLQELRMRTELTSEEMTEEMNLEDELKAKGKTAEEILNRAKTERVAAQQKTQQMVNNSQASDADKAEYLTQVQEKEKAVKTKHDTDVNRVKSTSMLNKGNDGLIADEEKFRSVRFYEYNKVIGDVYEKNKDQIEANKRKPKEQREALKIYEGEAVRMLFADFDKDASKRFKINFNIVDVNNKLGVGQKFMASERQVYEIIQDSPELFDRFMKRGYGAGPYSIPQIYGAQDKFMSDLKALRDAQYMITQRTTDLSVDIAKVLEGKEGMQEYIEGVIEANAERLQKAENVNILKKAGSLLASTGVIIPAGLYYVGGEHRKLDHNSKGHPLELTLGKGRVSAEAKLTALGAVASANLNDKENKLINDSDEFENKLRSFGSLRDPQNLSALHNFVGGNGDKLIEVFKNNPNIPEEHLIQALTYRDFLDRAEKLSGPTFKGIEAAFTFGGIRFGINGSYLRVVNTEVKDQSLRLNAIKGREAHSSHVRVTQLENGEYQYAVREKHKNLIEEIRKNAPNAMEYTKDGFVIIETPTKLNISSFTDVNTKGSKTLSKVEVNNTPDRAEVVDLGSTRTQVAPDEQTNMYDRRETLASDHKITRRVYSLVRNDPVFDKIILAISAGDYESAFSKLNTPKYKDIARIVTNEQGGYSVKKMQNLLTYTYGTEQPMNYNASRKEGVVRAENRMATRWVGAEVQAQESEFRNKTHKQTDARTMYPNQHIVTSVIATPADKSGGKGAGTDRVDHFDAPIEISNHIVDINNSAVKAKMLESHGNRVNMEVARINEKLGVNMTREEYVNILLTGTIPADDKFKGLKFVPGQEPQFKEARAMLHGNVCNNLTYMVVFPNFEIHKTGVRKISTPAQVTATIGAGSLAESVNYTELRGGVGLDGDTPTDTPYTEPKPDASSTITHTQTGVTNVNG